MSSSNHIRSWCLLVILTLTGAVTYQPPLSNYDEKDDDGSFFFHNYRPEIFHDNKVLPENVEVSVFLFKDHVKRVFFLIEKNPSPVSLTVTPCLSPIEWRLLMRSFPTAHNDDEPWYNQVPINEDANQPAIQTTYFGRERKTYFHGKLAPGLYVLELDSHGEDTGVRIYLTTHLGADPLYPELPEDRGVRVVKTRKDSVTASWKPIITDENPNNFEYCVSINPHRHYRTACALEAAIKGDAPPTPHPSSGFGFSWEKADRKKLITVSREIRQSKEKSEPLDFECVGRKTMHVFRNLAEGKHYFVDVFVVNLKNNATSSYTGVVAKTKTSQSDQRVRFNEMVEARLGVKNGYKQIIKFSGTNRQSRVWIYAQSCTGPGPARLVVLSGNDVIANRTVMDAQTLILPIAKNVTYTLEISSHVHTERKVRLWFSRRLHKYPFPTLPEDRRIKVIDSMTTRDSVTLAWKTTEDEKVKYCLYKRLVENGVDIPASSPDTCDLNNLVGNESKRERILCRRYHRFSRNRFGNVIMQKIRDLKPSTSYIFDIHVTKLKGQTLAYDSVWITTNGES